MTTIRDQFDAGGPHEPQAAREWGERASDALDVAGPVIHQLSDRSWSADVPSRTTGQPRYELRGWDDPADATNGIETPANLTDLDVWLDLNEYGIVPPWEA